MTQIVNPYLPLWEHVPDGEPHLFNHRVYIYGSHDKANATKYCEGNYVIWSAPEDDLSNWHCEGEVYRKEQDPSNPDGKLNLWAPDCAQGPDGRYYLYYCLANNAEIGVAVSNSPAGPFSFYGHVHHPDGRILSEYAPFDPAVFIDDDQRIYLYYGFAPAKGLEKKIPKPYPEYEFGEDAVVCELEPDMVTIKSEPEALIPGGFHEEGTSFAGHSFLEASSMRKINNKYYFIYSSLLSHELCYAISDYPDRDFIYKGILISNGDIGLHGNTEPVNTLGNNHGSILKIGEEYYIFYQRQTNGTECSRQGCAERIKINPDGTIDQAEVTSSGLNNGPLTASGIYPAAIACNITSPTTSRTIHYGTPDYQIQTRITEKREGEVLISDIQDGSIIRYKYFSGKVKSILLEVRGNFAGTILTVEKETAVHLHTEDWQILEIPVFVHLENDALSFQFKGEGKLDLRTIGFRN